MTDSAYIIVTGHISLFPVILASIYAPNWDNPEFVSHFFSRRPNMTLHHLILGGDINCILAALQKELLCHFRPFNNDNSHAEGTKSLAPLETQSSSEIKLFLDGNQTPGMSSSTIWKSLPGLPSSPDLFLLGDKKKTKNKCDSP